MTSALEVLRSIGIVPVIKIDQAEHAPSLARALVAGGIPCAEITFRTAQAEEAIRLVSAKVPHMLVGAGTVLTCEQVDRAMAAGARFIVSPGFNPAVVSYCVEKGVPIVPGCATPSEMEQAIAAGLSTVKFFPAEQAGGLAYLKAVSAPYSTLTFIPTGGISTSNLNQYLAFDKVLACGGSWMVPPDKIAAGQFEEITALCAAAVTAMHGFELAHVGVNTASEAEAKQSAILLAMLLGCSTRDAANGFFTGEMVEWMKKPAAGKYGHIGFFTNNVERAMANLKRKGVLFDPHSEMRDPSGRITFCYLKEEICGFALHLMEKPQ
jgi:2-dehydro-3-deoxyphosphogluconate aldolase/(4S)-4-hydroxy-2-oxoglutarate aldolase